GEWDAAPAAVWGTRISGQWTRSGRPDGHVKDWEVSRAVCLPDRTSRGDDRLYASPGPSVRWDRKCRGFAATADSEHGASDRSECSHAEDSRQHQSLGDDPD